MYDAANLICRALLSAVFVVLGYLEFVDVTRITNNPGTKRFAQLLTGSAEAATWLGYLIAAVELLGGLAILLGFKTQWVAGALVVYIIILTLLVNPFWLEQGAAREANQIQFYKNLAIIGGFLLLAITGAGRYSVDNLIAPVND
jgi:putative oxidoreductase